MLIHKAQLPITAQKNLIEHQHDLARLHPHTELVANPNVVPDFVAPNHLPMLAAVLLRLRVLAGATLVWRRLDRVGHNNLKL